MIDNDTISAISTAQGAGGIGIVRVSGKDAFKIGEKILRHPSGKPIQTWPERRVRLGIVVQTDGRILDEVVFFAFKSPKSYTGEDLLEIQGHGGIENLQLILAATLEAGARLAEPGEFTKRAFLNGRLDLTQAEAVIDLITAQTELAHQAAVYQLSGGFSQILREIEGKLFKILVPIEAAIDYPEEEIPPLEREEALNTIKSVKAKIRNLIDQAERGRILQETATVVLAGRPNVGKSSLLNALLNEERAIVTPIPGTTRDFVTETINLQGLPLRIVDTAGLREIDDPVEKEGVNRSWELIKKADLILFIIDSAFGLSVEDRDFLKEIYQNIHRRKLLFVLNKSDLPAKINPTEVSSIYPEEKILSISALTREGIEELKQAIRSELMGEDFSPEHPILVTRLRHKKALEKTEEILDQVEKGIKSGISEDLIAFDLRDAIDSLGEITGRSVNEDIINAIFSQFCVGK
ncbi:MAG TPA: tRNA uridine-5-carboxymethylaminomethyl(34) synthesis GTPase MnmE [Bacillota bacterium]